MGVRLVVRSSWTSDGNASEYVYEFDQERIVIGRHAGADVRIPHHAVSGHHATVRAQGAGYVVVDESSTNGTTVNGSRVPPGRPKPLKNGDAMGIGGFTLRYEGGVAVARPTSIDRTSALAKRIVREVIDPGGDSSAPPKLLVLNGPDDGKTLELPEPPARLLVGRGETCDLQLKDGDASREHAEFERDLDGVLVRDLGSKNGVLVNDRRIHEKRLKDRDEVLVGSTVLVFEDPAEARLRDLALEEDAPLEDPPEPAAATPQEGEGEPNVLVDPALAGRTTLPSQPPHFEPGHDPGDDTERVRHLSSPRPPARKGPSADLIIYLLAAIVLAISVAGLVVLLQSG